MEDMIGCRQQLEALRSRAKSQIDALEILEMALLREAQYLRRYDQSRILCDLQDRVTQELRKMRQMEESASYSFNKAMLITGSVNFALFSLIAAAGGNEKHPLGIGLEHASSNFSRTAPFGTIVVAVGPKGIPDDVQVISLSQCAREQKKAESEIAVAMQDSGYRLVEPEGFLRTLDDLREQVLKGSVSLPLLNFGLVFH
jgi:hypothetical protein